MNYKNYFKQELIESLISQEVSRLSEYYAPYRYPDDFRKKKEPTDLATKSEEDPIIVRPKDGSGRPQLNPDLGYSSKPQKLPSARLPSRFARNKFKGKFGKRDRNNSGFAFRPNTYM